MQRAVIKPRSDYESKVEELGLTYHNEPSISWSDCDEEAYWNEQGAIYINSKADKQIMEATY